ncbi:MAG TPA: M56 family metallopeptidase [Phycisphaerae bacterium]|nr:M56 family metallopeptidase [Phycisphaerae bacterium]
MNKKTRPKAAPEYALRRSTGYLLHDRTMPSEVRAQPLESEAGSVSASIEAAPHTPMEPPSAIALWMIAWRSAGATIADGLSRIPPIPPAVWLCGIAFLLAARALACARFARGLQTASRAPSSIQRLVRRSARSIGLSPAPQVLMIAGRVSPMVSFIGKRRLLLPTDLWSQLDEPGRQAIVYHELAHLRRRDDWVRWFENAVHCLYWWHPVVWWLCRRLRDEAENCCDAWVTWLMPGGRRAYAEALLTTRRYVGSSSTALPVVGIGATSVRAKRFARRLTMVMTSPSRPRISRSGAALTAALALAAWLTTPAWSSPGTPAPDRPAEAPAPMASTPSAATLPPAPPLMPMTPAPPGALLPAVSCTAPTPRPMTGLTPPALFDAIGTTVAGLMSATEYPPPRRRSDGGDLEARLERLERRLEEMMERLEGQPSPRAPRVVAIPRTPAPPGHATMAPRMRHAPEADGAKEWRHYDLPDGKREAMVGLMSRDDVPVLIRTVEGGIDVEATPAQHEIFEAFVRLIDPAPGQPAPERSRVRSRVRAPRARGPGADGSPMIIRQRSSNARAQAEAKEAELEAMEAQKEQLEELSDSLREKAESMRDSAEGLRDEAKAQVMKQVAEIVEQAKAMAAETKKIEQSLRETAREMHTLEQQADLLEEEADGSEDAVDAADAEDAAEEVAAVQAMAKALKAHGKGAGIDHAKMKVKEKDKERAKAAQKADEKISQNGDDGRAWYDRGYAYHMEGQYDKAREAFLKAAELGPRTADSLYNIACGYSLAGEEDQAIAWLEKAIAAGYSDTNNMDGDSDLDNIRDDSRVQKMIESLKGSDQDDDADDDQDEDEDGDEDEDEV